MRQGRFRTFIYFFGLVGIGKDMRMAHGDAFDFILTVRNTSIFQGLF